MSLPLPIERCDMTCEFENLEIAPDIHADDALRRRVAEATRQLQRLVGKSSRRLRVKWDLVGSNRIKLTLVDSTGQVAGEFTPDELAPTDELARGFRLRRRLSNLWGALLDIRMDIQLDRILHPEDEVAVP